MLHELSAESFSLCFVYSTCFRYFFKVLLPWPNPFLQVPATRTKRWERKFGCIMELSRAPSWQCLKLSSTVLGMLLLEESTADVSNVDVADEPRVGLLCQYLEIGGDWCVFDQRWSTVCTYLGPPRPFLNIQIFIICLSLSVSYWVKILTGHFTTQFTVGVQTLLTGGPCYGGTVSSGFRHCRHCIWESTFFPYLSPLYSTFLNVFVAGGLWALECEGLHSTLFASRLLLLCKSGNIICELGTTLSCAGGEYQRMVLRFFPHLPWLGFIEQRWAEVEVLKPSTAPEQ